jgi:hypothetical protein
MKQIRIARTVFAAIMATALVGLPTRPMLCDMATHEMAAMADGHHHDGPLGTSVEAPSACAECEDMTGCCLAPAGALYGSTPEIPTTPEHGQASGLAGEHLTSIPLAPPTPPPQA